MAFSAEQKRNLLARTLPERARVIAEVDRYRSRAGLSQAQLAHRVGYSPISIKMFLTGKYHLIAASDRAIRAALVDYMAAHPLDLEEAVEGKLYETGNVRLLRQDFYDALDRAKVIVRHGNPGTQKTWVTRWLIAELNQAEVAKNGSGKRAYRVRCVPGITPLQLLRRIARICAVPGGVTVDAILHNLESQYRRRRVLLVFDEAQHLSELCLEVLRELNDEPPHFGLMFEGSHDLKAKFDGFHMEQWRSRLHVRDSLPGMSDAEARQVITSELGELSEAKVRRLIEKATVRDERQRGQSYLSAREIFNAIAEIQLVKQSPVASGQLPAKAAAAGGAE